jgi:NADH-quinone oxidoreductase subunit H
MGALRAIAQLISYEVIFLLSILPAVVFVGSFSFIDFDLNQLESTWLLYPTLPNAIIFAILLLAETNRTPFDLPEAEAELVSGFNVEYSSILFAMFSLSEYNSMLAMSVLYVILFLGAWSDGFLLFLLKTVVIAYTIIKVRAALPRYRYDQLMFLCWYIFLPISLSVLVFTLGVCLYFNIILYTPAELSLEISKTIWFDILHNL